jgi:hypothetical protein
MLAKTRFFNRKSRQGSFYLDFTVCLFVFPILAKKVFVKEKNIFK